MRRWCAALMCAVGVFLVAPASPVSAHASFISSNPVDGSVLVESPPVAELRFSEEILASASSVQLLQLGSGRTEALDVTTAQDGRTLLAELPPLDKGAYVLRYFVVDPTDLHKTVGSVSFGIGVAAPPSVSGEQVSGSWVLIVLRGITDGALLLGVGAVVIALLLVRSGESDLERVTRLAIWSGCVTAAGWIGLLIADAAVVGFERVQWASLIINSDPGRRALIGVQLALGVWWTVGLLRRAGTHESQWFVVRILAVIAGGFIVVASYGGHSAIGGALIGGVFLRAVHFTSLSMWIGAVAAMWLIARRDRVVGKLWPIVSLLACIGLALTGASGLLLSGRVAVTVTALLSTAYGKWIIAKAGLLVVLSVLGAIAARRVSRGREPSRLPLEFGVAGVAVLIAAILASSAPARGEQFLPLPIDEPQIVTSNVDDLTVSASIDPARPGPNLVQLRVLDTRRPSPGPVKNVVLQIKGADGVVVAEREGVPIDGVIEWTDVAVPNPGTYRIQVDVTRPAAPVSPFVASWDIDAVPVPRVERVVSTHSWAPLAAGLAAGWILLVGVGWWGIRRLGQSPRTELN